MAVCDSNALFATAKAFVSLTPYQLELVQTALLCRILNVSNPAATCDPNTLLQSGACFGCLTIPQLQIIQTQLLCEILNAGGGGGGSSCIICANVDPTTPPACPCALYYRKDNMAVWLWDADTASWVLLIAP